MITRIKRIFLIELVLDNQGNHFNLVNQGKDKRDHDCKDEEDFLD
jgi:hypothetical protein